MTIKPLNSVAGFSVGEYPVTVVVDANSNVSANTLTVTGRSNLNSNSNVYISGGSSGQVLSTDGAGNLSWTTVGTGSLSNGSSNIQVINNGNITFSSAGNANIMVVTDTGVNVAGTFNATGVISGSGSGLTSLTGANVTGTVTSATNAAALLQNTSTATTVYPTFTSSSANGNSAAVFNTSITANLSNASITATTFVGALSGAATTAGTVTTAAQPNITSVGTLTSLTVSGNTTTGNLIGIYANGNSNINIPEANGNVNISAIGNANILVVTGTGVNVAGTLNTTGNANVGNIGAGIGVFTSNLTTNANLISDNILGRTGAITITSAGTNTNINLKPNGTGNIDANATYITSVKDPSNAQDAATKNYVDSIAQGLDPKESVLQATATTLPAYTYNNGTAGVGATLTATSNAALSIDGSTVTLSSRVLVKNETAGNAPYNGIYVVTQVGSGAAPYILTRATDMDAWTEVPGAFVFVETGSTLADTGWVCTSDAGGTIGTTAITFVQFAGAGSYTAGTGLTLSGTQFSITNTAVSAASYGNGDRVASFTVNAQGQLTAASNVVITANAANLTGTTLNSSVVTSSLTSLGTLSTLSVSGNASVGNISATNGNLTTANVSGNVILGNASVTTAISWASLTTTAITANQTIASFSVTGVTGVDFLVKGVDATGSKYSVSGVHAVTDGTNVDWSTFGGVNLGGYTGALSVAIAGGQLKLNVTPASTNSTVWTTQYRFV